MKTVQEFLKEAGTYYLATVDNDQPRVRPFGTATLFEDKIYVLTAKAKDVSKQLDNNAKFEISTMDNTGRWIRISGKLVADNRVEVHKALLEDYPNLRAMYTEGDANTNALYMDIDSATIYSFTDAPQNLND
ncbi:MAG: pyridoxamine 5'-phosphate oxidase family protein [Lachnospiraceae bacterium]|nr:pyridoxamine 5'-phosphate oxidase family protein [Lachnospiraceae bacterium]